ncbi:MAG TPA: anti-sigma factor [Anaeromyxobacter sp.]|nr:anti-sigma factor [Anaeromyxobacter sp.]
MSAARDPIDPAELMAFVDGRLPPERARAIDERLAEDPALAAEVRQYRAQRTALHDRFDPVLGEPIPARMLQGRTSSRRALARLSIAAALVLVGAAGGSLATRIYLERRAARLDLSAFAHQAVVAYAAYAPDTRRPVEIAAEQQQYLVGWLSKRLGREMRVPFLGDRGLTLVGGRLLPGEVDRPAAQLMYETARGERVTLFLRAIGDETAPTAFSFRRDAGVSTFYWVDRDWGYALTGPLDRPELLDVAKSAYDQLAR